jgi:hypothetical protein
MNSYIAEFNRLASAQEPSFAERAKLFVPASSIMVMDAEKAVSAIRGVLKSNFKDPDALIARCFMLTTTASKLLISMGMRHTVTIGDVLLDGKSYFRTSREVIIQEMGAGYDEDKPARAHAWITLEDGTIIDMSILPSAMRRLKRKKMKWIEAIYCSRKPTPLNVVHVPYLLGPEYIIRAATMPTEAGFQESFQWVASIDQLLAAERSME